MDWNIMRWICEGPSNALQYAAQSAATVAVEPEGIIFCWHLESRQHRLMPYAVFYSFSVPPATHSTLARLQPPIVANMCAPRIVNVRWISQNGIILRCAILALEQCGHVCVCVYSYWVVACDINIPISIGHSNQIKLRCLEITTKKQVRDCAEPVQYFYIIF